MPSSVFIVGMYIADFIILHMPSNLLEISTSSSFIERFIKEKQDIHYYYIWFKFGTNTIFKDIPGPETW